MFTYYYLVLKAYLNKEEGQDLIEYALIAGLLALAAVVALTAMSGSLQTIWNNLSAALGDAAG
ncbi:MAG TPA: Flp family type IVb pilin [Chloroflexi bacterium]|nr:Flp family type IVb pilin [Chloroflexota bacterium]HHW87521.1 Flp family type IVb pilin [Chloroflexota bacterium]